MLLVLAGMAQGLCAQGAGEAVVASAPAAGEPALAHGIRRLVGRQDFEGFAGTGESLPKGWHKTALPDGRFPSYVVGRLSDEHAHGGQWSFAETLNGANVAYVYRPGYTVHPNNDYLLTGWVRTDKLTLARAQARLTFFDAAGEPIAGAEAVSEPFGEPDGPADGQWQPFSLRLRGDFPRATRLQITLALVQPKIWQGPACKDIYQQDIDGAAWWDDLAVYRLPRISLQTTAPDNVFAPGETPRLKVVLDGIDDADCGVVLTVRNAAGGLVMQQIIDVDADRPHMERLIELADLDVGLYEGELAISSAGKVLSREHCRFVRLAEVPLARRTGLGIDATFLPAEQWETLLRYSRHLQAGVVKLPAWPADEAAGPDYADAWPMRAMLTQLTNRGITPTMVLPGLPPEMRANTALRPPLVDALADESPALHEAFAAAVAQYTRQIGPWQVGPTRDYEAMWNTRLASASRTARHWLGKLLVDADVLLGWNAMIEYDLGVPGRLSLLMPPAAVPEQIPAQLANFPRMVQNAHLELQDEAAPRIARLADFALRYAYTRAGGVDTIYLDPLWQLDDAGDAQPAEALLAARTLGAYLGDARYVGIARLDTQSIALVFRKDDGEGLMLLYSRLADAEAGDLRLDLPREACQVDLWGRRTALERRDGLALLRPGSVPVLIAGADAGPLSLRASLQMTPEVLPSKYQRHDAALTFTNPYDQPVTGQIRIRPPEGWTVSPKVERFALAPRQRWTSNVEVIFPYNASAGLKKLDVTIDIDARRTWSVEAPAYFYLALEEVAFDVVQSTGPDGALEVQQIITNRTDQPLSFDCFVQVPQRPRQTRTVQNLAPGATAVKLFRFPNVASLRGQELRAGLREVAGPALLNRTIVIR